jgi:hypothetical protein
MINFIVNGKSKIFIFIKKIKCNIYYKMTELNVNHLLCFVIIAMILYYIMGSCGCGFRVGGPAVASCVGTGTVSKGGATFDCATKFAERGGVGQNACIPRGESGCTYTFHNVRPKNGFRVGGQMSKEELEEEIAATQAQIAQSREELEEEIAETQAQLEQMQAEDSWWAKLTRIRDETDLDRRKRIVAGVQKWIKNHPERYKGLPTVPLKIPTVDGFRVGGQSRTPRAQRTRGQGWYLGYVPNSLGISTDDYLRYIRAASLAVGTNQCVENTDTGCVDLRRDIPSTDGVDPEQYERGRRQRENDYRTLESGGSLVNQPLEPLAPADSGSGGVGGFNRGHLVRVLLLHERVSRRPGYQGVPLATTDDVAAIMSRMSIQTDEDRRNELNGMPLSQLRARAGLVGKEVPKRILINVIMAEEGGCLYPRATELDNGTIIPPHIDRSTESGHRLGTPTCIKMRESAKARIDAGIEKDPDLLFRLNRASTDDIPMCIGAPVSPCAMGM